MAHEHNSRLICIHKTQFYELFNRNELQKLNQQLQEVEFPDDAEIKRKIQVIEKVINMKKIAFLNATNTNFLPECFRDFYMDNATKKIYPWVGNIEEKTRKKLAQELQKRNDTYVQGWKFPLVSKANATAVVVGDFDAINLAVFFRS